MILLKFAFLESLVGNSHQMNQLYHKVYNFLIFEYLVFF